MPPKIKSFQTDDRKQYIAQFGMKIELRLLSCFLFSSLFYAIVDWWEDTILSTIASSHSSSTKHFNYMIHLQLISLKVLR